VKISTVVNSSEINSIFPDTNYQSVFSPKQPNKGIDKVAIAR